MTDYEYCVMFANCELDPHRRAPEDEVRIDGGKAWCEEWVRETME